MTREDLLLEIDQAGALIVSVRTRFPADRLLERAQELLAELRAQVGATWPVPTSESPWIPIGRFAVRAFDDGSYPEIVDRLVHIEALTRKAS